MGLSKQWTFFWLKTVYSARNGAPTKTDEPFLCLFVKRERNGPASAHQGLVQPAMTVAMCCHQEGETHPPPPMLAQKLYSKQIAPTNNMQPKCITTVSPATKVNHSVVKTTLESILWLIVLFITLKKQVGCFNHRVVALVAIMSGLCEVSFGIRD